MADDSHPFASIKNHGGLAGDPHHVNDGATQLGRQLHHHLAQLAVPHLSDLMSVDMQQMQMQMQMQIQMQIQQIQI